MLPYGIDCFYHLARKNIVDFERVYKIRKKNMFKEEYIASPTRASSLPYWKTITLSKIKKIKIVDRIEDNSLNKYYFKLVHYLKNCERPKLSEGFEFIKASTEEYAKHINFCYENIHTTKDQLDEYKNHFVYDDNLWIAIKDKRSGKIVGSAIAELDSSIKEGVLEWVQVSKEYRNMGIGTILVKELLYRMSDKAMFVCVCGDMNNPANPLALYEKCGFTDKVIWCIE